MKYDLSKILLGMGISENFNEETELSDLGIDSIQLMEMVVGIEEQFGISIEDDDLIGENFETFGSIMTLLEKYLL